MTKDEIKKALEVCVDIHYLCKDCPYDDVRNCSDALRNDARELIIAQESEIDRLKANDEETCLKCIESKHATAEEYAKLQEEFANYQLASDKEIRAQVKQAKIDVLNDIKKRIYDISPYNPLVLKDDVKRFIEKLIKEVQNEN